MMEKTIKDTRTIELRMGDFEIEAKFCEGEMISHGGISVRIKRESAFSEMLPSWSFSYLPSIESIDSLIEALQEFKKIVEEEIEQ